MSDYLSSVESQSGGNKVSSQVSEKSRLSSKTPSQKQTKIKTCLGPIIFKNIELTDLANKKVILYNTFCEIFGTYLY